MVSKRSALKLFEKSITIRKSDWDNNYDWEIIVEPSLRLLQDEGLAVYFESQSPNAFGTLTQDGRKERDKLFKESQ